MVKQSENSTIFYYLTAIFGSGLIGIILLCITKNIQSYIGGSTTVIVLLLGVLCIISEIRKDKRIIPKDSCNNSLINDLMTKWLWADESTSTSLENEIAQLIENRN